MNVLSILIGGGILTFIQFIITRYDGKHDKFKVITEAIDKLSERIDQLDAKEDERNAITSRIRILRFADEMADSRTHSKDSWDQVMSDITHYNNYCEEHPHFKNDQTAATVEYIKQEYRERLERRDFR